MRFRKPVAALSLAGLLALAACGGGEGGEAGGEGPGIDTERLGDTGSGQDPDRQGPVEIEGAEEGGTVTVVTNTGLTTSIDPQDIFYTDTNGIMAGLVTRSLTQYVYDEESGQMVLVPDLATDLGTANDDFTEWRFEIRDGVRWENGDPVTAEDVARGIIASMDARTFPNGPGYYYSNPFFLGGTKYKGPYTADDPEGAQQKAVTVEGDTITIRMARPYPDFPYYAAFPAIGPRPAGADGDPATYAQRPWSTGPYKITEYTRAKSLVLERNDQWDPATDPGRTQYPDGYVFKAGMQASQVDQILLADRGEGQTTLTYDDVQAQNFRKFQNEAPDRLVLGGSPCTYYLAPDYRKITDRTVREALVWAYPYKNIILSSGLIPDVTAVPATNILPPGIPGRTEFEVVEGRSDPLQTDPERARQLLEEAGALNFEIKFLWATDDEVATKSKDVLVKALEEAGFQATPVATSLAQLAAERDDPDSPINLRTGSWCSDWPSAATWIPPLFESTDVEEVGLGTNYSVFSEPAVDQRIKEISAMPPTEQADDWDALAREIISGYLAAIPRWYTGVAQSHGSRIEGHFIDNTLGQPTWKNLHVVPQ